jgi:hypothetical protein
VKEERKPSIQEEFLRKENDDRRKRYEKPELSLYKDLRLVTQGRPSG